MRPRLHAVIDATSPSQAVEWARVAVGAGMDGIFLISHAHDDDVLVASAVAVRKAFSRVFLGVNVIGRSPAESLRRLHEHHVGHSVDALWTDNAGVDSDDVERRADAFAQVKASASWAGLHFGGIAFKYQPTVDSGMLAALTESARRHVDVVTTSGAGTGRAIDPDKLATMRAALDRHPLALASGVTAENVAEVRDHVDHILVSTGIKGSDGAFDVERIAALRRAAV